jgi:hypothetical protein
MTSSTQTRRHAAIRNRLDVAHQVGLIKGWSVTSSHRGLEWDLRGYALLSTVEVEQWLIANQPLIDHRIAGSYRQRT